jgi:hypothetical protein
MAINRLVGADASLYTMAFAAPQVSGTLTSGQWYRIATISGAVFPVGYEVGDLILGNGSYTASSGNQVQLATPTLLADVNSFELSFSKDEIEVTTLADQTKKYRSGKTDLSGTINGINFISEMNRAGSIANRFFKIATISGVSSQPMKALSIADLYGQFYIQDDESSGETSAFLFGEIELFGYNLGAAVADAQSWSSAVRFTNRDPIMYFRTHS